MCTAAFQVAYGLGYFGERIRLAHDRSDVTGLDLLTQRFEVNLPMRRDIHGQPLGHHRREHERPELPPDSGPLAAFAASDDERPVGSECPPQPRQAAVPADVQDQVIVLAAVGKVLPGVVDDLVGADRADQAFAVLATPVTVAPKALASCTA